MTPDRLIPVQSNQIEKPESCLICHLPDEYKRLAIAERKHWKVGLYDKQVLAGRTIVTLKRHSEQSMAWLALNEFLEFQKIYTILEHVAESRFGAARVDWFNLQNVFTHTHIHAIPRYAAPVEIASVRFEDPNYPGNYGPYDRRFKIPHELEVSFIETYRSAFELEDSSSFRNSF